MTVRGYFYSPNIFYILVFINFVKDHSSSSFLLKMKKPNPKRIELVATDKSPKLFAVPVFGKVV